MWRFTYPNDFSTRTFYHSHMSIHVRKFYVTLLMWIMCMLSLSVALAQLSACLRILTCASPWVFWRILHIACIDHIDGSRFRTATKIFGFLFLLKVFLRCEQQLYQSKKQKTNWKMSPTKWYCTKASIITHGPSMTV